MKSNYKKLGSYIREVNVRNTELKNCILLGVSVSKEFIPSIANTVGTDFSKYKIVNKNQFTYIPDTSRRGDKIGIALLDKYDEALVSQAYTVFEIIDTNELLPEYLMMWFRRPEFDRYARFKSEGSVREIFSWKELCNVELPIPNIEKQKKIVTQYNQINEAIKIKESLNNNLEQQAQAIFKSWFVDFEPFGKEIPDNWETGTLEDITEFSNGYAFKSEDLFNEPFDDCYHVFKQGHIKKGGGFNYNGTKSWFPKNSVKLLDKFILKKGDILMAMTDMKDNVAILGNTALMDVDNKYVVNQRVGLLRSNYLKQISPYYIYLLTNSKDFVADLRRRANVSVQVNLSSDEIKASKLLIPSEDVNIKFNSIITPIFEFLITNNKECQKLIDLRDTLLPKLMLENS